MKKALFWLSIAYLMFQSAPVWAQTIDVPFEIKKTGTGNQSLIFIPGFASSGDVWKATTAHFEAEFTCYTFTMAGFAGIKPQKDPSFEKWKTAIATYIQQNNIKYPILIGHSMGGALALAIAADFPELIGKIIIVDALPCLSAMMNPSFKSNQDNDCSKVIEEMQQIAENDFLSMQENAIRFLVHNPEKQKEILIWSMKSDRKTFAGMYCDFLNTDLRDRLTHIQCPALILLESNFINFKEAIESQYYPLKNARIEYAGRGLHFIMFDDPEWYMLQLSEFITGKNAI